ncbi:MAG: alanine--glyoxylate aminotransferase family protein [Synergistetes bacterium]|nr:alanine--glyoxylate aminotransferase family protein [Synergistota bacterium]MCX8127603.1 alanine--glyoxylate aminotransferase family protein [Synergistota bacterium]MDW8191480.1 alanine--glyoxylate aminotransferase family protein [Synergistota bacterium]
MREVLLIPGPTPVPEEVRASMFEDMIDHRGHAFGELMGRLQFKLRKVFMTSRPVYIFPGTGTGALECAVSNLFDHGEEVLSLSNGSFAERWAEIAQRRGLKVDVLEFPYGEAWDLELIEKKLKEKRYSGILMTHNETSTGVLNPLKETVSLIKRLAPDTLTCVDAVSSLGGAPLKMDEWDIDVVLTASQKALMSPPGLALIAVSERAFKKVLSLTPSSYYWDLKLADEFLNKSPKQTPYTPALSLLYALDKALTLLIEEGIENSWKRHKELSQFLRDGLRKIGFDILPKENYASPTVSAIKVPQDMNPHKIKKDLEKKGVIVAGGMGPIKDKVFRVAHMGNVSKNDIIIFLDALKEVVDGV